MHCPQACVGPHLTMAQSLSCSLSVARSLSLSLSPSYPVLLFPNQTEFHRSSQRPRLPGVSIASAATRALAHGGAAVTMPTAVVSGWRGGGGGAVMRSDGGRKTTKNTP